MDAEKIKKYQIGLEGERVKLIEELLKEETPEDFGSDVDHFDEETNEAESMSYHLAEAQTTKGRINAIDTALNKIQEGRYGVCEKCGEEIDDAVLNVAPESRLCQTCKKSIQ